MSDMTTNIDVRTGNLIRSLRQLRGATLGHLAEALKGRTDKDLSAMTIGQIEVGKRGLKVSELDAIAPVLGVTAIDFLAMLPKEAPLHAPRQRDVKENPFLAEVAG